MTRLAALGREQATGLLIALLLLIGYGISLPVTLPILLKAPDKSDAALYRAIDARMHAGDGYYHAAAAEQRARHYPLKPFVTMRLPTLASLRHALGPVGTLWLLGALVIASIAATVVRLRAMLPSRPLWAVACVLLVLGAVPLVQPVMTLWHEAWAGLFVALALACRSERRWWPSVVLGLAAVLIRELALPFLIVMALVAARERRRVEALGWAVAILVFGVAMAAHAVAVTAVLQPGDPASQGWASFGGWQFILALAHGCTLLRAFPTAVTAIIVPIALLGWAAAPGGYATRTALTFCVWIGAFFVIGRPDNFYWGLLMAPLLLVGAALAIPAVRDLFRAALGSAPHPLAGPE